MKAIHVVLSTLIVMALVSGCDDKSQKLEQQSREVESLKKELAELKAKEKQDEETKKLREQISTITQGEANGQVFIVTKSRENVKMGLVTVSLFDADYVRKTFVSLRKDLLARADGILTNTKPMLASVEKLRIDYETNRAAYETAKTAEESGEQLLVEQFNNIPGNSQLLDANVEPMYLDGLDSADTITRKKAIYSEFHEKLVAAREARKAAAKTAELKRQALNDAVDAYNADIKPQQDLVLQYPNLCVASLAGPVASVKTDADGKFKLQVPKSGEFVLIASASRETGKESESYLWAIVDSLAGKDSKEIFLSNDNLANAYPTESVIERLGIDRIQSAETEIEFFDEN